MAEGPQNSLSDPAVVEALKQLSSCDITTKEEFEQQDFFAKLGICVRAYHNNPKNGWQFHVPGLMKEDEWLRHMKSVKDWARNTLAPAGEDLEHEDGEDGEEAQEEQEAQPRSTRSGSKRSKPAEGSKGGEGDGEPGPSSAGKRPRRSLPAAKEPDDDSDTSSEEEGAKREAPPHTRSGSKHSKPEQGVAGLPAEGALPSSSKARRDPDPPKGSAPARRATYPEMLEKLRRSGGDNVLERLLEAAAAGGDVAAGAGLAAMRATKAREEMLGAVRQLPAKVAGARRALAGLGEDVLGLQASIQTGLQAAAAGAAAPLQRHAPSLAPAVRQALGALQAAPGEGEAVEAYVGRVERAAGLLLEQLAGDKPE